MAFQYYKLTPYLVVRGVAKLLDYLKQAFDAVEVQRVPRPDGSIAHAEVRIGDNMVMMGEPSQKSDLMPASLYLMVSDCDALYRRALEAGGSSVMEPAEQAHAGCRYGGVKDPSGNIWWLANTEKKQP